MRGDFIMARTKRIKNRLGARVIKKNKNPFLNDEGGLDLIEIFPTYKDRSKDKKSKG